MARKTPLTSLKQISEINLTPLMDLTFILLITFIITFPLIEQGIPVDLPAGEAEELTPERARTITLDEDVAAQLRRLMHERDITFKAAVNSALRAGLGTASEAKAYHLPTYAMGVRPGIDLDRALSLDAALEDEETVRQLRLRK